MIEKRDIEEICDMLIDDIKKDRGKLQETYLNTDYVEKKGYTRSIMLIEEAKKRLVKILETGQWEATRP
jgi:hypothetical protein